MSMVLSSQRLICGINPKLAKKICKMCYPNPQPIRNVAESASITEATATEWLASLSIAGYLEPQLNDGQIFWHCTPKGYTALATARIGKPMSGIEFSNLLQRIIDRAEKYNECKQYPLHIDKVYIFGAVLSQPWLTEDPNVVIAISERESCSSDPRWRSSYWEKRVPDKHLSIIGQLYYAEDELYRFLKKPKEHFSLYNQEISELTSERRLLYVGDAEKDRYDDFILSASEIAELGASIEKYRNIDDVLKRRKNKRRLKNAKLVSYWKSTQWFSDLQIPVEQAEECCWRCGSRQDVQQCHIVPHSLGGDYSESNLVLLCARCHAEGPNLADSRIMLDWISSYRKRYGDDYWANAAMDEYARIYGKTVSEEVEEALFSEDLTIGFDEAMSELRLVVNEVSSKASFHFGQAWMNDATMAGCFRIALEKLPIHLRGLGK